MKAWNWMPTIFCLIIKWQSDQGLVGRFNDQIVNHFIKILTPLPAKLHVWVVGERAYSHLANAKIPLAGLFTVANSVSSISSLIEQILIESEAKEDWNRITELQLFYNTNVPGSEIYTPVNQQLLPLNEDWQEELVKLPWQTNNLAEVIGNQTSTLEKLIREYIFISLYRACAESLASENASRLASMQRADKNINELLEKLKGVSNRLRQSNIDEELFDVISGFEALK